MVAYRFAEAVTSLKALRGVVGEQSELVKRKDIGRLDEHCRAFIARSPFVLVGTASTAGQCDVSPRGDAPGFALVLDDKTLVLPERPGNKRVDTLGNIIENPNVGLLFLVPGVEETLRVNGHATIVRDEDLLQRLAVNGKAAQLAIVVDVEQAYLHCAKSFKRAKLWDSASQIKRRELPSLGRMVFDQLGLTNCSVEDVEASIEEGYKRLY